MFYLSIYLSYSLVVENLCAQSAHKLCIQFTMLHYTAHYTYTTIILYNLEYCIWSLNPPPHETPNKPANPFIAG